MSSPLWRVTLYGAPRTKKNSQRIFRGPAGRPFVAPSAAYAEYERNCIAQIRRPPEAISEAVSVRCLYYMPTRRRVDLVNLLEAACDILVKARVLADDCAAIVASHDGSRVLLDKKNPRVEIKIEKNGG